MFPFSGESKKPSTPDAAGQAGVAEPASPHPLDAATSDIFSASTSGERAQRVEAWLATDPDAEMLQQVYRELSAKDKGAARALRDRLDELRRARAQEALVDKWQEKAQALLAAERLNIADGLAWERDAAAEGAPLSREPLAGLRTRLAERMRVVEDLQQRVMVQVEAATLLSQRIELLSTKPWDAAVEVRPALETDVAHWNEQAAAITGDAQWPAVELRYPPQLEAAQNQLRAVWDAFVPALEQAVVAAADASAPLPPVQVWADQLQQARGQGDAGAGKPRAADDRNQQKRETAAKVVQAGTKLLEHAVAAGNTKDVNSARQALRRTLKAHGQWIDDALEARVHAALVSAGELQGWQRWSADMAREQLVARAEGLLRKRKLDARPFDAEGGTPESVADDPADDEAVAAAEETVPPVAVQPAPQQEPGPAPQAETDTPARTEAEAGADATPAPEAGTPAAETADSEPVTAPEASQAAPVSAGVDGPRQDEQMPLEAGYVWEPVLTGRKLQDALRKLREEWKTADSGGAPNQALWRRFDRACNTAHAFVMQWLEQVRAEEEKNAAERKAMIAQLRDWAAAQAGGAEADWKRVSRDLRRFSQRWRDAGHVAEKRYRALQQEWKQAMTAAGAPLEQAQKASQARRQDLIAQAQALGAEPELRINAIRALQASWQAEARAVPLNRKREQKLWEAFRKPLDEAFQRKDAERERRQAAISAHDEAVLAAARILEQANAGGDAARIREAMEALEAATRSQSQAAPRAEPASHGAGAAPAAPEGESENKDEGGAAAEPAADTGQAPADGGAAAEQPDAQPAPAQRPRRVVAVRGDDRPDAAKPRASRVAGPRPRDGQRRDDRGRRDERRPRNDRPGRERRGPAMGHSARRASQQAVDNAQQALRQLAARAHGEALVELLSAWRDGNAAQVPEARDFGRAVTPAVRNDWSDAVAATGGTPEQVNLALLRLEEAAEAPSPANQLDARRALKLQLLTQRDDPSPAETWPQDVGAVLASDYEAGKSERLQKALKILLQKR